MPIAKDIPDTRLLHARSHPPQGCVEKQQVSGCQREGADSINRNKLRRENILLFQYFRREPHSGWKVSARAAKNHVKRKSG